MTKAHVAIVLLAALLGASAQATADEAIPAAKLGTLTHIHGIAVDRAQPGRLHIATHHGFFVVGADGMAVRVSPVQDFMGFTPDPASATLYASGHPAEGGNLGFIVSHDGGGTWTQVSPGAGGPVDFHAMDASPANPRVLYGSYGGIQVSRDGGETWAMAGPAPEGLIDLAAAPTSADRLYAATRVGLWSSADGGASWQPAGFDTEIVSLVAAGPGGVYAFVVGRGLLTAPDRDPLEWTTVAGDFGERVLLHLAFDPGDATRAFAVTQESEVLASADGGRNWRPFGAE